MKTGHTGAVTTRIISGMLCVTRKKPIRCKIKKTESCNGNLHCRLRFLISYLIGPRTIKMSKSNQSVHGFWIHTVSNREFNIFSFQKVLWFDLLAFIPALLHN